MVVIRDVFFYSISLGNAAADDLAAGAPAALAASNASLNFTFPSVGGLRRLFARRVCACVNCVVVSFVCCTYTFY